MQKVNWSVSARGIQGFGDMSAHISARLGSRFCGRGVNSRTRSLRLCFIWRRAAWLRALPTVLP